VRCALLCSACAAVVVATTATGTTFTTAYTCLPCLHHPQSAARMCVDLWVGRWVRKATSPLFHCAVGRHTPTISAHCLTRSSAVRSCACVIAHATISPRRESILLVAEAIGAGVLSELGTQRETIIRVGGKVANVDSNLGKSRRILNAMGRRIMTNHLIMVTVSAPRTTTTTTTAQVTVTHHRVVVCIDVVKVCSASEHCRLKPLTPNRMTD
jgi:hypothetical protein